MVANRKKVAVLISGRGSNMAALVQAAKDADYPAEIALVLSNNPDAKGLEYARKHGILAVSMDHREYPSREDFDLSVDEVLKSHGIEFVCLAGYMRIISPALANQWHGRMLNIHPSLLPSFKGLNTHKRALDAGVKIHGCTVHFVAEELDSGQIIIQGAVPVLEGDDEDTLASRVLEVEHRIYPQALSLAVQDIAGIEACSATRSNEPLAAEYLIAPRINS